MPKTNNLLYFSDESLKSFPTLPKINYFIIMLLFGFNKQNSLSSFSMSLGSTSLNIVSSRRLTSRIGTVLGHVALLLTNIASASKWSRWQASRRNKVLYRTKWYWVHWCHHAQASSKKILRGWRNLHLWEQSLRSLGSLSYNSVC